MALHLPLLAPPLRKEEEPHIQHKLDETDAERFNAALRFLSLANSQRFLLRETKRQRNHRLLEEIEALDIMKEYVHVHGACEFLQVTFATFVCQVSGRTVNPSFTLDPPYAPLVLTTSPILNAQTTSLVRGTFLHVD